MQKNSFIVGIVVLSLMHGYMGYAQQKPFIDKDTQYRFNYVGDLSEDIDTTTSNKKHSGVFFKSLMLPGLGQISNKQAWKIPIIYGLLGGLVYNVINLNNKYGNYRAAHYNAEHVDDTTFPYGPTPAYLQDVPLTTLRVNRDKYRNERDFFIVLTAAAYLLNAIDAYVFSHLGEFDISDDLSMGPTTKLYMRNGYAAIDAGLLIKF